MKQMKKSLALLLSLSMIATATIAVAAQDLVPAPNVDKTSALPLAAKDNLLPDAKEIPDIFFRDLGAHWATPAVTVLAAGKYVQGMGDGTFMPEKNVTRAEFVTMAVNALRLEEKTYGGGISDVKADQWFANRIETAKSNGILADELFNGGAFAPDSDITREDAALIVAKVAEANGGKADAVEITFTDAADISAYAAEGVKNAYALGLLAGYPDGTFKPKATLTRAEASELLVRAIEAGDLLAIYVDPVDGSDGNVGSKKAPVATVAKAQELVRANNDDMKNHLFVFLKAGEYYLDEDIKMNAEDSGSNGYNIVYTSYGDGKAQLMSGKHFGGFEIADAAKNIYKVQIGDLMARQVYINGIRGVRARSDCELTNPQMTDFGFWSDDTFLADYKNIKDLEFVTYSEWTQPRCGVSEVTVEDGRAKIVMDQPGWSNNNDYTSWRDPYWYENAYELLDLPGEWYIDSTDGYLYYIPRQFENPETMVATVPIAERLLTIDGTVDAPAHNITFDNLEFAYTNWLRPSSEIGYNDGQNNTIDGKLAEPAVMVFRSRYIDFTNNTFTKLGAAALQMMYSIQECNVVGNEFYDLSGSAIGLGKSAQVDYVNDDYETEVKPKEYKYYTINNHIDNNYIHDIGIDYGSSTAISATWPKYTTFNHNEIYNVNYSGMQIGYGWGMYDEYNTAKPGTGLYKVEISHNYIHDVMNSKLFDGGPIYTLGGTGGSYEEPNLWTNNYLENSRNGHGSIYPDEGSTFWWIENNVIDYNDVKVWKMADRTASTAPKWLHIHTDSIRYNTMRNNYASTASQTLNSTYNNIEAPMVYQNGEWPEEAQNIIKEAGLEDQYLEKYPNSAQRFNTNLEEYVVKLGAKKQIETTVFGRKQSVLSADEYELYYVSSDPSVASVDENGTITAVAEGRAQIYVSLKTDDVIRTKIVNVICGDHLNEIELSSTALHLIKGYKSNITVKGKSKFGKDLVIEKMEFVSADDAIAKAADDGAIEGISEGSTIIHGKFTVDDVTIERDIPVTVIAYGNEEAAKLPSTKLDGDFFKPEMWKSAQATENGKGVAVTGSNSAYTLKLKDGLYSFDMSINNPNTWPSIAFKVPDLEQSFSTSDCYFFGFKADHIEVQRFKAGVRTMFLGSAEFKPIGGPGVPNNGQVLEYGKTYHVTAGTIEEEDGVRLILTINGKNIVDYKDTDENALRGDGYMSIYVGPGDFTFTPYTGE